MVCGGGRKPGFSAESNWFVNSAGPQLELAASLVPRNGTLAATLHKAPTYGGEARAAHAEGTRCKVQVRLRNETIWQQKPKKGAGSCEPPSSDINPDATYQRLATYKQGCVSNHVRTKQADDIE